MKRILFITATRLGDAVISSGVLAELIRRYPGARITVACGPVAASYFEPCPAVERVIVMTKKRFDLHWVSLWWKCSWYWWDLVIDLRGSGLSFFLPATRRRVHLGGRKPGARIGHLSAWFRGPIELKPEVWTRPEQEVLAGKILPATRRYCGLGPTANWSGKIWPAENFAILAQAMQAQGLTLALFYGPGQAEYSSAAPLKAMLTGAIDLGGQESLGLVAALLRRCSIFIGNDSGLMHLAAAVGTPTLGLFGPTRASEYAPTGRNARIVVAPGPEGEAPIAGLSADVVVREACALLMDKG